MKSVKDIFRFFFQKRSNDFDANETFRRNQARYNALYALDPDVLVRHLAAFRRGDICGLERVLDEFEEREDKMRIGSFKMAAAVASKPWEVRVNKGEEENPRAKLHQKVLTRFWSRVEVTDAFCRNRRGGLRLLVKQMMSAQSRVYSVHDIVWRVNGDGSLDATFTHVPAWCFENRTGRLRYIRDDGQFTGEEMRDGEWLVAVGEGVGVAAAILAMAKRLSWNDWLLFSEKCGMPVVMGNTSAQRGTDAWESLKRAIAAVAPKTGILADTGTQLQAVSIGGGSGKDTYRELVDTVDRAISALYRGGDLATVSSGPDAAGVNAQDGESELMDADGCAMVAETLRDQVEKYVIRFTCGDFEPLAGIVINPPAETEDIDREIKIDDHLANLGVRLSKKDALARYGRTEATDDADALKPAEKPQPGLFGGLANERPPRPPDISLVNEPPEKHPRAPSDADGAPDAVLAAFAKDTGAAAEAVAELLENPTPDRAAALLKRLPELLPEDPALASIIAEEMAKAYGEAFTAESGRARRPAEPPQEPLANEITNPCPKCHRQMSDDGTCRFCEAGAQKTPSDTADNADTSGTPDASSASAGAAAHTPEQQKRIEEYQASTDQAVVDFVNKCQEIEDGDDLSQQKCPICKATPKFGSRVKELTGLDTTDWTIELRGERARHLDIRHGGEGQHDHSLADVNDIGRLGYVMKNFDSMEILRDDNGAPVLSGQYNGRDGKPSPVLETRMRIDGTYAVQHAVPDSKWQKIYIVSARIEKAKEP